MSAEGKVIITQKMLVVLLVTVITMHCPSNCLYCINSYKLSNEAYITFVTVNQISSQFYIWSKITNQISSLR